MEVAGLNPAEVTKREKSNSNELDFFRSTSQVGDLIAGNKEKAMMSETNRTLLSEFGA